MAVFKDTKLMEEIFGEIWMDMINNTEFGSELKKANMTIFFVVHDPDVVMFVDEKGPVFGEEAKKRVPTVTMKMSGDTVHKFWLKKVNVPKALATREMKAKGPIPKVLKILPLLKPGQEKYPSYCQKYNLPMDV
jgi:putative sterol carrier protein